MRCFHFNCPLMSKEHDRLLSGLSWCESTAGSQFLIVHFGACPARRGRGLENRCSTSWNSGCESLVLRHFVSPSSRPHGATVSTSDFLSENPGADPGAGAIFNSHPSFTPDSSKGEQPAHIRKTAEHYRFRRPSYDSLCSSIVEHPPDKRKTTARYRVEGPFLSR